jgi:hypothetical protein
VKGIPPLRKTYQGEPGIVVAEFLRCLLAACCSLLTKEAT